MSFDQDWLNDGPPVRRKSDPRYHDPDCKADRRYPRWHAPDCTCTATQHTNKTPEAGEDA